MYTLDTNILIYHTKGEPKVTNFIFSSLDSDQKLFLSTITIIEFLCYSALTLKDQRTFMNLLPRFDIVSTDLMVSLKAANFRRHYNLKLGDSIIAPTAIINDSVLVTRNIDDFRKIPDLQLLAI